MKIQKYKKKANGKYSLFLDDGREFVFYEETILQYNLLLKKEIDEELLLSVHQTNLEYDVYYVALNSLKHRARSIFELKEYLLKKEYPFDMVNHVIDKLVEQKYLDDRSFTRSYIHTQMVTTSHGPNRIKSDLISKKVSSDIIEEELDTFTEEEQKEKIKKIIDKLIKSNHSRGGFILKQKIINDLKIHGYDLSIINCVINQYEFKNDCELAKKEYDKYYQKYSGKYEGYELNRKIREKLFQKGLVYEEE